MALFALQYGVTTVHYGNLILTATVQTTMFEHYKSVDVCLFVCLFFVGFFFPLQGCGCFLSRKQTNKKID